MRVTNRFARVRAIALIGIMAPLTLAATQNVAAVAQPETAAAVQPAEDAAAVQQAAIRQAVLANMEATIASENAAFDAEAAALRPGQYIWRAERAASGPVEIVVSLEAQMAYVYRAGTLIAATTVSTGRAGHRTPTGSFTILQKNRRHFSNLYNNAPMPNMQRLTWDGIALHAGALPGYPASHGCIRLPMEFSRLLFDVTRLGTRVHVIQDAPPSAIEALTFAQNGAGAGRMRMAAR
jgi:lipoprotein-anchoring transpeptidase ErfK/SrfK